MGVPDPKSVAGDFLSLQSVDPQSVDLFLCGLSDPKSVAGDSLDPQGEDPQSLVCGSHSVGFQRVVTLTMTLNPVVHGPFASRVHFCLGVFFHALS